MKIDRVFVLLLVVLLPMTGCFDDAVGEVDAQEDTTSGTTVIHYNNTTVVNHYYHNNTTINENLVASSQSRTWFASGGTFNSQWNMDGVDRYGEFCIDFDEWSCQETAYIGNTGGSQNVTAWDFTECTEQGGYTITTSGFNAPTCVVDFATITTLAGEVLMIYEFNEISVQSTCNGVANNTDLEVDVEYNLIIGSAMDCTHKLSRVLNYDDQEVHNYNALEEYENQTQNPEPLIWSIVYAIQDVTVV